MIGSIGNSSSMAMMMTSSSKQRQTPPAGQDVFKLTDTNKDGSASKTELAALVQGIEEITGNSMSVDDALTSFDANQDGGLSGEEMLQMMTSLGFSPSQMESGKGTSSGSEVASSGMRPPPPPPPPSQSQEVSLAGDTNGDGVLSLAELQALIGSEVSDADLNSTPVSTFAQALASYKQNSGESKIAQLMGLLQNNDSGEKYASLEVKV